MHCIEQTISEMGPNRWKRPGPLATLISDTASTANNVRQYLIIQWPFEISLRLTGVDDIIVKHTIHSQISIINVPQKISNTVPQSHEHQYIICHILYVCLLYTIWVFIWLWHIPHPPATNIHDIFIITLHNQTHPSLDILSTRIATDFSTVKFNVYIINKLVT